MRKLSKLMALLMLTIMVIGSLAACGKKDASEDNKDENNTKT